MSHEYNPNLKYCIADRVLTPDMKRFVFVLVPGAGIWSRFVDQAVVALAENDLDYDDACFIFGHYDTSYNKDNCSDPMILEFASSVERETSIMKNLYGIKDPYRHIVNYAIEQDESKFINCPTVWIRQSIYYDNENRIEQSPNFIKYKNYMDKIRIKKRLIDQTENRWKEFDLTDKTLSVHVRLTTFTNKRVSAYGANDTVETYFPFIDAELASGNYDQIFLSSDNGESIKKLVARYGSLVKYNKDFKVRYNSEIVNSPKLASLDWSNLFKKYTWEEAFIDVLMLAKGRGFVCRAGNFTNAAILKSKTFENIVRVI